MHESNSFDKILGEKRRLKVFVIQCASWSYGLVDIYIPPTTSLCNIYLYFWIKIFKLFFYGLEIKILI